MQKLLDFFTLFTSASTLICCALPALLVAIGAGSVMASLVSVVPGLIWVSANKVAIFIFAGGMLCLGALMQWRVRTAPCPSNEAQARQCTQTRRISARIYLFSLILYLLGGFFAFIAPRII